jgi:Tfp pilus assembly protein PilO
MNSYKKYIRKYQGLLISIGIIIFIVICVFVGLLPAISSIKAMRSSVSELSAQVAVLEQKATILESIDEETYKNYLKDLALAVPTDKSLTSLFSTIDGLSRETGVTLSDFTLARPGTIATDSAKRLSNDERKLGSSLLPFTLTVSGTYDQIRKFVENAVLVRRFFRIRYFSISFDQKKETISVHMGMDAYYASLPTNLGSATQTIEGLTQSDQSVIEKVMSMAVLGQEEETTVDSSSLEQPVTTTPREDPFSL